MGSGGMDSVGPAVVQQKFSRWIAHELREIKVLRVRDLRHYLSVIGFDVVDRELPLASGESSAGWQFPIDDVAAGKGQ